MADTNELEIIVRARDEASAVLKGLQKDMKGLGEGASQFLGDAVNQASQLATAGLAALAVGGGIAMGEFMEFQQNMAQTNAVLKSTGGVAGVTADQVISLSQAFQKSTKFSHDQVQEAENLLLTFTNIGKDIFPQATETVLNMATALGEDTKSASIQLGKALQDPILGVTALRRVGVNFNETAKETIKHLVETGKSGEAQAMILKELQVEFGGSAKAAGATFGGQLIILKNALMEVMEAIGKVMVNYLTPLVSKMKEFAETFDFEGAIKSIVAQVVDFGQKAVQFLQPVIDFVVAHKKEFIDFFEKFGMTLVVVVPTLALLGGAFSLLTSPLFLIIGFLTIMWELWEKNRLLFSIVAGAIGGVLVGVLVGLATTLWTVVIPAVWAAVAPFAPFILAGIAIGAIAYLIISNWGAISGFFTSLWNDLMVGINWLKDHWLEALGFIIGFFFTLPLKIGIALVNVGIAIGTWLASINWGQMFSRMWQSFEDACGNIVSSVNRVWNYLTSINWGAAFTGIAKGIGNGVIDLINGAIQGAFSGVPVLKDHIPRIPRFSQGVENFEGGLAYVHQGEVLVNLPQGTSVIPKNQVSGGAGGVNINVQLPVTFYMGTPVEAQEAGIAIAKTIVQACRAQGLKIDQMGALI